MVNNRVPTLRITVEVVQDWSTISSAQVEVPTGTDPKVVAPLVADIIPQVTRQAAAELVERELAKAAEASAV